MNMDSCCFVANASASANRTNHFLKRRHILVFQNRSYKLDGIQLGSRIPVFIRTSDTCVGHDFPTPVFAVVNIVSVITPAVMLGQAA